MNVNDVALYLEGSHTPVPENAESRYLAGQRILVRGGCLFAGGGSPYKSSPSPQLP